MPELLSHFFLKFGGNDASPDLMRDLTRVEVDDNLFLPDMFVIELKDPDFTWAESQMLQIGQEVEILSMPADDQAQPKRLIIGEITAIEPEFPNGRMPVLIVRGYDRAHRLHRGKKVRTFVQMTDSDIVTKIAREYGLKPEVDQTTEVFEHVFQNNQTDFEFIMERSRKIDFNFLVDNRSLVFKNPSSLESITVEVEYGSTLWQFQPRMSTSSQFKEVIVKGWDPINKREIVGKAPPDSGVVSGIPSIPDLSSSLPGGLGEAANNLTGQATNTLQQYAQSALQAGAAEAAGQISSLKQKAMSEIPPELQNLAEYGVQKGLEAASEYLGEDATSALKSALSGDASSLAKVGMDLGSKVVEKAFGDPGSLVVTQHPVKTQAEADQLAKAIYAELTAGNLQAEGLAAGNPDLTAGCKIKIKGLGKKFSGEYFVTHTRHLFDEHDGYLTEFSISGRSPNTTLDLLTGGAGSNPGMNGNSAPSGVVVGLVTNNQDPTGQGRVKVKFPWLDNDQESSWARVSVPMAGNGRGMFWIPEAGDEVVVIFEQGDFNYPYVIGSLWNGTDKPPVDQTKAVDSSGNVVQRIIKTRTGHTILLDDSNDNPGIQIIDQTGNNKIIIDSKNNTLSIEIDGDVTIKSSGKVSVKGDGDVSVESTSGISIKSDGNLSIEASGSVKIKGATIDLN